MKIILGLCCIVCSTFSFGQKIISTNKPSVFLDSNKIDLKHYLFDQTSIVNFDVVNTGFDSKTNPSGTIYIKSKLPKIFNFLSYDQIKSKHFSDKVYPILLLLNGEFIKSPENIFIDSSYISKVEVEQV